MTPEGFYWATISAILFSMLFARKEGVAILITIAGIGMLYASGSVGSIYSTIYNSFDSDYIIDGMFLSVILGLIYLIWTVFFTIFELVAVDKDIKRYFSDLGIPFLSFFGVVIMSFLYILLCYNASAIICSLAIPIIIFAFAIGSSSSKENNGDDYLTFALFCSIMMFGIMYWFNNLLDNYNIVLASGCQEHEYSFTCGASFVPASFLIIPILMVVRFIGDNLMGYGDDNNQENIDSIRVNKNDRDNETE